MNVSQHREGRGRWPLAVRALPIAAAALLASSACSTGSSGSTSSSTSSTAGAASANKPLTIYGVAFLDTDPSIVTLMCGMKSAAQAVGANFVWKAAATVDVPTEVANFQAAVLQNPGGIAMAPFSNTAFVSSVRSAMTKGIPVVTTVNTLQPAVEYKTIGEDAASGGVALADYLGPTLKPGDQVGVIVQGAGDNPETPRVQGFTAEMAKKYKSVTVLPTQYDNSSTATAAQQASALIAAHPKLTGFFAGDGVTAQGIASAIKASGRTDIKVVTYDATPQVVDLLKAGEVTAIAAEPVGTLGADAVNAIVAWHKAHPNGGAVTQSSSFRETLPIPILTRANINDPANQINIDKSSC